MTVEELMRERYKVIADYPANDLPVGAIITFDIESVFIRVDGELFSNDRVIAGLYSSAYYRGRVNLKAHPHLFKKLEWWEERKVEDMPNFLKFKSLYNPSVWVIYPATFAKDKSECFYEINDHAISNENYLHDRLPSTKKEYTKFLQLQEKRLNPKPWKNSQ